MRLKGSIHLIGCALIWLFIGGCHYRFSVTKNYLKSSAQINNFQFKAISVSTFDADNKPSQFNTDTLIDCFYYTSLSGVQNNKPKVKKVLFNKPNAGYIWREKGNSSSTLPVHFSPNRWYLINLVGDNSGNLDYYIFIHVTKEGKWDVYHKYKPGPF